MASPMCECGHNALNHRLAATNTYILLAGYPERRYCRAHLCPCRDFNHATAPAAGETREVV